MSQNPAEVDGNETREASEINADSVSQSEQPSTPRSQFTNLSDSTDISSKSSKAPATGVEAVPRKPAALPANASLADRIAALQKSSSIRRSDRSASSVVPGTSNSNGAGNGIDPLAGQSRSVSSGAKIGSVAGVRDRIAKFQTTEAKPLIPKSSFGSPAPMHGERNQNALRPYPGANASGGGSGSWGEGVLRPQATGGAWGPGAWQSDTFAGAGANVRPQMTGNAWLGVGGSSPSMGRGKAPGPRSISPGSSLSRSPLKQRDAFLELDEEAETDLLSVNGSPQKPKPPMRRDPSFSEAQLAAAQVGLGSISRAASSDGTSDPVGTHPRRTASSDGYSVKPSGLPRLPDPPRSEIKVGSLSQEQKKIGLQIPTMPPAPSSTPKARSPSGEASTNDVEIGVANVSPEKLELLRRTASESYADSFLTSPLSDASHESRVTKDGEDASSVNGRSSLMYDIQSRRREKAATLAARSAYSPDEASSDIGRLVIESNGTDDGSATDSPAMKTQDLPARAQVQRTESDRVDPSDPDAHKVMGAGLLVPQDEVATANENGGQQRKATIPTITTSTSQTSNGIRSNNDDLYESIRPTSSSNESYSVQILDPTGMKKSNSEGLNEKQNASFESATQAKQAITAARSKSQNIKRPPPGRMMTAAEMDASDDEYEPGWVSVTTVMSSSRKN
ncbi:uncharacterized protein FA14DRAFT_153399 [Meira miltonrushii]|uniref:Altered inheritance of mitochondria protein 21 n=1 Tax=Meira miltonrushii TaxID=1280837 RepID=A0A316VKK5_9BASI|nr:uncharacterized protein FA14DRAFT_153399 [Meira miltonrushii]PWN38060.1 hypothetical protein FA14DRAFT_153399 [Meira miltonrushii]